MKNSTVMKWITGIMEALLGVPFLGGLFIFSMTWTPLMVMLVLHIITLALSAREDTGKSGSISGIIASALGWIPILGMLLHMITAALLLISAFRSPSATDKVENI